MKKLLIFMLMLSVISSEAQKTADAQLNSRLQEYIGFNKQLNFKRAMDYTHPKLFTIAPKEMIIQSMEQAFNNKDMRFRFDSMSIVSVTPVYKHHNISYRKVVYYMDMTISLSDSSDLKNQELAEYMLLSFESGFPGKKITVDIQQNAIKVAGTEIMFAIKDPTLSEWMFLGYDKSKTELNRQLYPTQVRQYFKIL